MSTFFVSGHGARCWKSLPLLNPPSTDIPGRRVCSHWEVAGTGEGGWYQCVMQCPSGLQSLSPSYCGLGKDTTSIHLKSVRSGQDRNEWCVWDMVSSIWHGEICLNWCQTWLHWQTGIALPRKTTVVTISNMATATLARKSSQSSTWLKNKSQLSSSKVTKTSPSMMEHLTWAGRWWQSRMAFLGAGGSSRASSRS